MVKLGAIAFNKNTAIAFNKNTAIAFNKQRDRPLSKTIFCILTRFNGFKLLARNLFQGGL